VTIDQLVRIASDEDVLRSADMDSTVEALGLSIGDVCDAFATRVAERYLRGEYSYTSADAAMNALFAYAYPESGVGLPSLAFSIYEAFDEGEYHHADDRPNSQGEDRTRALLARVIRAGDG
jgi:hypothetical protein